jgi:hypothetical protein
VPAAGRAGGRAEDDQGGQEGRGGGGRDGGRGRAGPGGAVGTPAAGQAQQHYGRGHDRDAGQLGAPEALVQHQPREQDRHHQPGGLQRLGHGQRFQGQHDHLQHQAAADQHEARQPGGRGEQGAHQPPQPVDADGGQVGQGPLLEDESEAVDHGGQQGQDDPQMRPHDGLAGAGPARSASTRQ